jgi:hypothetical protein
VHDREQCRFVTAGDIILEAATEGGEVRSA